MIFPDAAFQAKVDLVLQNLCDQFEVMQATIFTDTGNFWQGVATHKTPPTDKAEVSPDRWREPKGGKSWHRAGMPLPSTMPISVTVDVYQGPQGSGYIVTGAVILAGTRWIRSIHVGPEQYRDVTGWRVIE